MPLGRIAYERWREGTGIPATYTWSTLPRITQEVWETVARAVLEWSEPDMQEGRCNETTAGEP